MKCVTYDMRIGVYKSENKEQKKELHNISQNVLQNTKAHP